ncbi:MAG: hypothetical protein NZ455_07940 [Bacteroidia bacterium]|nr:hypothetical protein [Bacteroidia bacterium]MDW8345691.1 hypothetical protein [Bacteroidia bacterium]
MNKVKLFLIGCFYAMSFTVSLPQQLVSVYGKTMKADGFGSLSQVIVRNKSGIIGKSDENGFFSIVANSNDSLILEHIGYLPVRTSLKRMMRSDTTTVLHHVFMFVPTSYTMKEVKIYSYTREELVQAFLKMRTDSTFDRYALDMERVLLLGYKDEHTRVDMVEYMLRNPSQFRNFTISDYRGVVNTFGPTVGIPVSFARKPKPYSKKW